MKLKIVAIFTIATLALSAQETKEKNWSAGRPDGHAPISVMGDHMHGKGEWMFSYRYMHMNMEGLKKEDNTISTEEALADYMVTPTAMPMNMHMLGAMYAPSNKVTLMAMVNVLSMNMDHLTRAGGTFNTEASGFGDTNISVLYRFFNKKRQNLHAQLGISLPTGSITESDVTPASTPNETELPYPMQIGSGTYDGNLGLTYLCQKDIFSFGTQIKGVFRFGKNDREYKLGNRYSINSWTAVKASDWFSFSARIEGITVTEISGADPNLVPAMVTTADTNNSGGNYLNSGIGINLHIPKGALKNLRLGLEFSHPLYQKLNGIQLQSKENIAFGIQYSL